MMPTSAEDTKLNVAHLEKIQLVAESIQWEHVKSSTEFADVGFFAFKLPS